MKSNLAPDDQDKQSMFDERDAIWLVGLALIAAGVTAQFSWPVAAMVSGAILIAIASGRLMK
jgi:hypothetical protein